MHNRKLRLPAAAAALLWVGSVAGGGDQGPEDIKEFVWQVYIHGIPFAEVSQYGVSAVPALLEMLQDPEEQAHWPNIVVTLGMIGDKSSVEPLLERDAAGTPSRS